MTDRYKDVGLARLGIGGFGLAMMMIAMAFGSTSAPQLADEPAPDVRAAEVHSAAVTEASDPERTQANCIPQPFTERLPKAGGAPGAAGPVSSI